MLERIFLKVIEMSLTADIIILIVCVARMLLKRFPKYISYMLWSVVLFRLLCPMTLEAGFGVVPDSGSLFHEYIWKEAALTEDHGGLAAAEVDEAGISHVGSESGNAPETLIPSAATDIPEREIVLRRGSAPEIVLKIGSVPETDSVLETDSVSEIDSVSETEDMLFLFYGKYVWLAGIGILFLYCNISFAMMQNIVRGSKRFNKNIYIVNEKISPFVMGIFEPAIYLPAGLGRQEQNYIILHERLHIRRLDHIIKPMAFAALCIHWFNPLVWLAYSLFCKDMEMSCDEAVVRKLGTQIRADYSESLLMLSLQRRNIRGIPVDFGEGDIKGRIKNLAALKQTKMWVRAVLSVSAALLIISLAFTQRATASGSDVADKDMSGADADVTGADMDMTGMDADMLSTDSNMVGIDLDISAAGGDMTVSENADPLNVFLDITDFYVMHTGDAGNLYHIDEAHVLWGSGKNDYGQLGQGTRDDHFHGEMVKIAENVIHVDFADQGNFAIFITEDHKLYGMGNAGTGALQKYEDFGWEQYAHPYAYRESNVVKTPVLLMEDVVYACCGKEDIACLKEDGTVWIWGTVFCDGSTASNMPRNACFIGKPKKILDDAVLVTGGWYHHAALLQDGTVWAWGYNGVGNCGIEGYEMLSVPMLAAEGVVMVWTDIRSDADGVFMEWTESTKDPIYDMIAERYYDHSERLANMVIQKTDGSYWICGENVGTEEKVLYGEGISSVICSAEFYPCE